MKAVQGAEWPFGLIQVLTIQGAANGLAVPSVRLLLAAPDVSAEVTRAAQTGLMRLADALDFSFRQVPALSGASDRDVMALLRLWVQLMAHALGQGNASLIRQVAGDPVLQRREGLFLRKGEPIAGNMVLWPIHWPEALAPLLAWSLRQWREMTQLMLVTDASATGASDEKASSEASVAARAQWKRIVAGLALQLPAGLNPPRLLAAAHALKRPVLWLDRETLQIGHGRRARLLRSTLTDATPSIGVSLARDKVRTNRLLCQAGVPTPRHLEVADAQSAVQAAAELGWPVVVKPADQDRGDGARANLHTPEQVTAAFEHAAQISKRVLVEQHVDGHEYRLTVVNGKLFWAHERVPASVTGDGQHTLQQLIDAENARRQQALLTDPYGWVPIQMDADNLSYLLDNGRTLQDIPAEGEVVRLQRVPAATTGGGGRAYFDTIHPDNRLLAERAAQLLRLDIAGVDLIMPDITRSWREVGGAVTEVNAIPQVSLQTDPTLAQRLLQRIMPHSGRIPVLFVLAATTPAWVADLASRLNKAGFRVGLTTDEGLHIGQDWIRGPRASLWDDIRALQIDPSVGAMVVVSSGDALLQTGLPFDVVDALVVEAYQPEVLSLMLPYVRGFRAMVGEQLRQQYGQRMQAGGQSWQTWASTPEVVCEQINAVNAALLAAEAAYAQGPAAVGVVADPLLPKTTDGA